MHYGSKSHTFEIILSRVYDIVALQCLNSIYYDTWYSERFIWYPFPATWTHCDVAIKTVGISLHAINA